MKRYMLKKFKMENSLYDGYLIGYVLEYYGRCTAVVRVIKNESSFPCETGDTRLIYCCDSQCEFFESVFKCENRLEEVKK